MMCKSFFKKIVGVATVAVVLGVGTPCFAQSNNEARRENDARLIVGTWNGRSLSSVDGNFTYNFNANGTHVTTMRYNNDAPTRGTGNYFISGSKVIIQTTFTYEGGSHTGVDIYEFHISPDGRTLVFENAIHGQPRVFVKQ